MGYEDIAQAEETVRLLMDAELEVHHRLEGHERPVADCPVCRVRVPRP